MLSRNLEGRAATSASVLASLEAVLERVDARVGPRDVALLVGLYAGQTGLTPEPQERPKAPSFDEVARELDAFIRLEFETPTNSGSEPLDPNAFGNILPGIRRRR